MVEPPSVTPAFAEELNVTPSEERVTPTTDLDYSLSRLPILNFRSTVAREMPSGLVIFWTENEEQRS